MTGERLTAGALAWRALAWHLFRRKASGAANREQGEMPRRRLAVLSATKHHSELLVLAASHGTSGYRKSRLREGGLCLPPPHHAATG